MPLKEVLRTSLGAILLAAIYAITARLSLEFASINPSASPVWPPTGLAIAVLVVFGYRFWPGIFLGAFLANLMTQGTVATSLAIGGGNALEALAGAYFVHRWAAGRYAFSRWPLVINYVLGAALTATMISPSVGVTTLAIAGYVPWDQYGAVWMTWWLGDATGALVAGPPLILWLSRPRIHPKATRLASAVLLLILSVVAGSLIFTEIAPIASFQAQLTFLLLPIVIWAAIQFGDRGASTTTLALSMFSVWGTIQGFGPFALESPNHSLLLLQAFMAVLSVTGLLLAAVMNERKEAGTALRRSHDVLESTVAERTSSLRSAVASLESQIEERKRAEQLLRLSEARLLLSQEIARIGSWEWEVPTNKVTWSNELYRIFGLEPQEFKGTFEGYLESVHPEDHEMVRRVVSRALEAGEMLDYDYRIVRADGTIRWLHAQGKAFLDDAGRPIRMAGTAQDITDRKGLEAEAAYNLERAKEVERLREIDEFRTRFMSTAAHEINTPLTPIKLQLRILQTFADRLDDSGRRSIEILERNIDRLTHLVGDLLDSARLQASRFGIHLQSMDLSQVVAETVQSFQEPAREAGLALDTRLSPQVMVQADRGRITQVLFNLLNNAVKFTPSGGRVLVEVSPFQSDALVAIHDTGFGLAPEQAARLFKPFVQVHDPSRVKGNGTGLGLYISRGLVELHGGRIWCESPGTDQGSTFFFTLPLRAVAQVPPPPEAATQPPADESAPGPDRIRGPAIS